MKKISLLLSVLLSIAAFGQNSLSIKSNEVYKKAMTETNLTKRLDLLNVSLDNDANHTDALIARGMTYKAIGRFKDSENDYLKVLRIDPENQSAFYNYGNLCLNQNKIDSAITLYKKATKVLDAYRNLSSAYYRLDSIDLAYKYISIVVQTDSSYFEALDNLAAILFSYGEFKTAAYLLDKSEKINPKYLETHLSKIALFSKTQQKEQASKEYKKIKNENLTMEDNIKTGYYLFSLGLLNESLELSLKALKLEGDKSDVYNAIGLIYLDSKKFNDAIENFKSSINENENNSNPYINIGYTYNEMNKFKDAIDYYTIAIKKFDKTSAIFNNIGYSYLMDNQLENAKSSIEKAIEIDTNNSYAYKNYALLYKKTDSKKACDLINKAIYIDKENIYREEYQSLKRDLCK